MPRVTVSKEGAAFMRDGEIRLLRARMRLLERLLREYRQDHNDRTNDALDGAQNNGCYCGLCDRTEEVLK